MKSIFWLLRTEIFQNKFLCLMMMMISFSVGLASAFGYLKYKKIEVLAFREDWNADLVILPKGISLNDLREELLHGNTKAFIPEALFESIQSMSQDKFRLSAVLPITEGAHSIVLHKGADFVGVAWLQGKLLIKPWQIQNQYQTAEWGGKVLAGFFAQGPFVAMQSLKELIDRKTIAQAFWISEQLDKDKLLQQELYMIMNQVGFVFFILVGISSFLLIYILKARLRQSFGVYNELGIAKFREYQLILGLSLITIIVPFIFGIGLLSSHPM